MTAKRFILYEHKDNDYILDNPNVHLDFIEMLGDALTSEEIVDLLNELADENEQLKQELFESEKEWYECHYADNPVRLDSKLEALKEEFKERFGRDFE